MGGLKGLEARKLRAAIDQSIVREIYNCDYDTGILTRRLAFSNSTKTGDVVGCLDKTTGYLVTSILGVSFYVHYLVWVYWNGNYDTSKLILDHRFNNKLDNRPSMLRLVDKSMNAINTERERSDNTTGVTGVSVVRNKSGDISYRAQIHSYGKCYAVGTSSDFTEAVCLRYAAEQCRGWDLANTNSSAYQYLKQQGIIK